LSITGAGAVAVGVSVAGWVGIGEGVTVLVGWVDGITSAVGDAIGLAVKRVGLVDVGVQAPIDVTTVRINTDIRIKRSKRIFPLQLPECIYCNHYYEGLPVSVVNFVLESLKKVSIFDISQ
jgi:hypothetical protein